MLHPDQFSINEAWIVFKLNNTPITTGADGDFNLIAMMDASSLYILSNKLIPANSSEPSQLESKQLIKEALSHQQIIPKTLFIPDDLPAQRLRIEAESLGITIISVPAEQLLVFVGEAQEGFNQHFGNKKAH